MDKFSVKFDMKYIVLVIGFILTSITIALYAWHNQWVLTLDSTIKILGLGVGATTAIYAAMNLRHIYDSHIEAVAHKKKEYSAHLMERWLDPEMTKISISANSLLGEINKKSNDEEAYKLFNEKHDERHSLLSILNFFELMAISINTNVADEPMLKDFFRGVVTSHYNNMIGIIDIRRKKANNQRIFKDFEMFAKKWS